MGSHADTALALAAAGAIPDLDLAVQHCKSHPAEFLCVIGLVEEIISNGPLANLSRFNREKKINAISIAAPAFESACDNEALAVVDEPVQIWSGSMDERVPHATNGALVASALPGKSDVNQSWKP